MGGRSRHLNSSNTNVGVAKRAAGNIDHCLGSRRLRGVIALWPAAAFWCDPVTPSSNVFRIEMTASPPRLATRVARDGSSDHLCWNNRRRSLARRTLRVQREVGYRFRQTLEVSVT